MKTTVKVADIKRYLKAGGSRAKLAEHVGFSYERTIDKWVARRRIPRWQQKRVWEFLINWERDQQLKGEN
jgi:hypothetical protein